MPVPGGVKAGKISKPYGLHGEVYIILIPDSGEIIKSDCPLFIDLDGQRVPFFVEEYEVVSKDQAIVKFEFIHSLDQARRICGCDAYFETNTGINPGKIPHHLQRVVSFQATDTHLGLLGPVTDFIPDDMNPIFIVSYKGKELIIPAAEDIIQQINTEDKTIQFNLPEGLTEL
jgi:16S rRNA processing protein RimM